MVSKPRQGGLRGTSYCKYSVIEQFGQLKLKWHKTPDLDRIGVALGVWNRHLRFKFDMQAQSAWGLGKEAAAGMACVCAGRCGPLTNDLLPTQLQAYHPRYDQDEKPFPCAVKAAFKTAFQEGSAKKNSVFRDGPKARAIF